MIDAFYLRNDIIYIIMFAYLYEAFVIKRVIKLYGHLFYVKWHGMVCKC